MSKNTRLEYIMDALSVTTHELSEFLHVDKTLVSKWRSGKRILKFSNEHLPRISHFLLGVDNEKEIIQSILKSYYYSEFNTERNPEELLGKWICDDDLYTAGAKNVKFYKAAFTVYLGREGMELALLSFIDRLNLLPDGQVAYLCGLDRLWLLTENACFVDILIAKLDKSKKMGHRFNFIFPDDFGVRDVIKQMGNADRAETMRYFVQQHTDKFFCTHFFRDYFRSGEDNILLAVENHFAIKIKKDINVKDSIYTAMFTDTLSVNQIYAYCTEKKLAGRQVFEDFANLRATHNDTYLFYPLPIWHLGDCLLAPADGVSTYHIFSYDDTKKVLDGECVPGKVLGRAIDGDYIVGVLHEIKKKLLDIHGYHVLFLDRKAFRFLNIYAHITEDTEAAFLPDSGDVLYVREPMIINLYKGLISHVIANVSPSEKSRAYSLDVIESLLHSAKKGGAVNAR